MGYSCLGSATIPDCVNKCTLWEVVNDGFQLLKRKLDCEAPAHFLKGQRCENGKQTFDEPQWCMSFCCSVREDCYLSSVNNVITLGPVYRITWEWLCLILALSTCCMRLFSFYLEGLDWKVEHLSHGHSPFFPYILHSPSSSVNWWIKVWRCV